MHTHTHTPRHSAVTPFCRILLWVLRPRWVCWLAAPEELVGRDSWAKLLKYGQEFPLSLPLRQLALLCAIMEIKCTAAWNEGGKEEGQEGEDEVGEWRSKNGRFMGLGRLKVIKSKDYSTAKLLKFSRKVEGFSAVLNSHNIHYSHFIFTPFLPLCSPYSSFLPSSPCSHPAHSQYQVPAGFRGASLPPISPSSIDRGEIITKKSEIQAKTGIQQTAWGLFSNHSPCEATHTSISTSHRCQLFRMKGQEFVRLEEEKENRLTRTSG